MIKLIHGLSEEEKFKVIRPLLGDHILDQYNMPVIHRTSEEQIDFENMIPVGIQNLTTKENNSKKLVLPFNYDKNLLKYWNDPMKYIPRFQSVMAIGTPDYSVYPGMNKNEIQHNVFMSRWLELRKSNYVPYIGEHKPELCNKGMNDIFIDLVDRMMFVQYMMLMGIFEGFWDILIELSKEDGVEGNLSQPNGIRRGSFIHKNIGKEIVNKEAWMYKIHDDKDSFYFLANKRIIHIEKNEGKSEVYGIAYPKEDIGLFEKEIVTE